MITEEWKSLDFIGQPMYEVSNTGRVRNAVTKRILNGFMKGAKYPYHRIAFHYQKPAKVYSVYRLVATAFVPNPDNKPEVDHIDGNSLNDDYTNLRWVTHAENMNNDVTIERFKKRPARRWYLDESGKHIYSRA